MRKLFLLCLILSVNATVSLAQQCLYYNELMRNAKQYWSAGDFEKALNQLAAAREHCPGKGAEIDSQSVAFTKEITKKYVDAARSARANRLAALAMVKAKTDYTLGWHLASLAYLASCDPLQGGSMVPGVSSIMLELISDTTSWLARPLNGHKGSVTHAEFSQDGQLILTWSADSTDRTARLWDKNGNHLKTLERQIGAINGAKFSPDGQSILITSFNNSAQLWDKNGLLIKSIEGHSGRLRDAVFSSDGQCILTVETWDRDNSKAKLWNKNGQLIKTLEGDSDSV